MSGFALEKAGTVEVVAAWTVPQRVITAVAVAPGWNSLGEFYLPKSCDAKLDVVAFVAASGLTFTARLWDTTAKAAVNGSVSTTSQAPTRLLGETVTLTGDRTYQLQVQCVGSAGDNKFGIVSAATITD
jgi:hypothetical protein